MPLPPAILSRCRRASGFERILQLENPRSRAPISARAGEPARQQRPDGHWCGELLVDSTLCSNYILFMPFGLGEVDDSISNAALPHPETATAGWRLEYYYGGPSEVNASVKLHFALKLRATRRICPLCRKRARTFCVSCASEDEYLQQALPRVARANSLAISPVDSRSR